MKDGTGPSPPPSRFKFEFGVKVGVLGFCPGPGYPCRPFTVHFTRAALGAFQKCFPFRAHNPPVQSHGLPSIKFRPAVDWRAIPYCIVHLVTLGLLGELYEAHSDKRAGPVGMVAG